MCSALHKVVPEGIAVKLSEIKCGDEVFYGGEPRIAIKDGRLAGDRGEAATMATIWLAPSSEAGVDANGMLEFGYGGEAPRDVADEDVPLLRSGVEFYMSSHRSVRQPDGTLACEKTLHTAAEAAMCELRRQKLRRDARAASESVGDGMFRKAVRNALTKGVGVAEVRQETGLSRERIYQIRDNRR